MAQPVPGSGRWAEDSLDLGWKLWLWACQPGRNNLFGSCQSELWLWSLAGQRLLVALGLLYAASIFVPLALLATTDGLGCS